MAQTSPFLRRSVQHLRRTMKSVAGVDVSYVQGGVTYSLRVVPKRPQSNQETADGLILDDLAQDFFIKKADLAVTPRRDDLIAWEDRYFQVLHPGGGREVEEAGNFGDTWRVHCKVVPTPADVLVDEGYANTSGFVYGNKDGTGYGASP